MAYRVLVFGHSFVERFKETCIHDVTLQNWIWITVYMELAPRGWLTLPKAQG